MMSPRLSLRFAASTLALLAIPATAQTNDAPTGTSMPLPAPLADTIPPPKDIPYPGTIKLAVDATDTERGIFRVTETIPVQPGHLVLLYPKWLPGNHSPTGQISKIAGLVVTAGGKTIPWKRDPIDVFAFHLDVPAGVDAIEAKFQYLSPTAGDQGRTVMTPEMLSLQWNLVALYPAGYFVRQIMVSPSATYPEGWTSATALRPSGTSTAKGGTIQYETVAFDTLVDSPAIAGRYARIEPLSPDVTLDILADRPDYLQAKPEQIAIHKTLIAQATKLFGAQHYNHYDFLFTLSSALGGMGWSIIARPRTEPEWAISRIGTLLPPVAISWRMNSPTAGTVNSAGLRISGRPITVNRWGTAYYGSMKGKHSFGGMCSRPAPA